MQVRREEPQLRPEVGFYRLPRLSAALGFKAGLQSQIIFGPLKRQKARRLWWEGRLLHAFGWWISAGRVLSTASLMGEPRATQGLRQLSGDPVVTAPIPRQPSGPWFGWKLGLFSHKGIRRLATVG